MTPASRDPVLSRGSFFLPERVEVVDGTLLAWEVATDEAGLTFRGGDDLLPEFLALTSSEPEAMAEFMEVYGIPELCQHGRPDRHPDSRRKETYCRPSVLEDGRMFIRSADLRRAALAFDAARTAALVLSGRQLPNESTWASMIRMQIDVARSQTTGVTLSAGAVMRNLAGWKDGRQALASWLTGLLRDCGVVAVAGWSDPRLRVEPEADGLLGTLALLLAREVGQGDRYTCDVCAEVVDRVRPPREGEGVYCSKPACRREQQRRNRATWRARKKEGN